MCKAHFVASLRDNIVMYKLNFSDQKDHAIELAKVPGSQVATGLINPALSIYIMAKVMDTHSHTHKARRAIASYYCGTQFQRCQIKLHDRYMFCN